MPESESKLRVIEGENFSKQVPLTPLYPDEPCHFIRCNLFNCLVHPKSIVEGCQVSQQIRYREPVKIDGKVYYLDVEQRIYVGKGVRGEITALDVNAVRETLPEDAIELVARVD